MGGIGDVQDFEILDDQGHKTGQILPRDEIHDKELWHEVVNVWVMNHGGEVLIQLRGPGVDLAPNVWDMAVGTHVRPNEDPTDAGVRCLQSELGITIERDQLKHLFNVQSANPENKGKLHKVLGHVFLLKRDLSLDDCTVDPSKVANIVWKDLITVMAEVGGTETAHLYMPRGGNYYPQLFDALQAEMEM